MFPEVGMILSISVNHIRIFEVTLKSRFYLKKFILFESYIF